MLPYLAAHERFRFPQPLDFDSDDVEGVAMIGGNLSPGMLISAFRQGIFPWYEEKQFPLWCSPRHRFVIFPENFHVAKSLRRRMRRGDLTFTQNHAFGEVIRACAAVHGDGWLHREMIDAYCELHRVGAVISVEAWQNGELVGGFYGQKHGAVFSGESMFTLVPDATRAAFADFAEKFWAQGGKIIDTQTPSSQMKDFGGIAISRHEYLARLQEYLPNEPAPPMLKLGTPVERYAAAYRQHNAEILRGYLMPVVRYITPRHGAKFMTSDDLLKHLRIVFRSSYRVEIYGGILLVFNDQQIIEIALQPAGDDLINAIIITPDDGNALAGLARAATGAGAFGAARHSTNLRYTINGVILIKPTDDPRRIIDEILATDYEKEYCLALDFSPEFCARLMRAGFYVMSVMAGEKRDIPVIMAKQQIMRATLDFSNLHLGKSTRRRLAKYALKFNADFETILDRCVEIHGGAWMTAPLVKLFRRMRAMPITSASEPRLVSFGVYRDGVLRGGEFGVIVGNVYSSYSGYREETGAGAAQLVLTAQYLRDHDFAFWDLGMTMGYKNDLGARDLTLREFIPKWRAATEAQAKCRIKN